MLLIISVSDLHLLKLTDFEISNTLEAVKRLNVSNVSRVDYPELPDCVCMIAVSMNKAAGLEGLLGKNHYLC